MRRRRNSALISATSPSVTLWLLRILVALDGYREFIRPDGLQSFSLASRLGFDHWSEFTEQEFDWRAARQGLKQLYKDAEQNAQPYVGSSALKINLAKLAELVGLSDVDCAILGFAIHLKNDQSLETASEYLGALSSVQTCKALAIVLGLKERDVHVALSSQAILAKSGLLKLERHASTLKGKLELLSDDFAEVMAACETDPIDLVRGSISRCSAPELQLEDYEHIGDALKVMRLYLKRSIAEHRIGVNVFLYGRPGTGKTQLAKVLAESLECALFEIACDDSEGEAIDGDKRLRALCVSQCFFAERPTLVLFDEVEDVFADGESFTGRRSTAQQRKAWMNRTLEENPVPTIWISNSRCLDPAFIRRFDIVMELPIPPRGERERISRKSFSGLLPDCSISRIADSEELAPALITRASSVVKSIRDELGEEEIAPAVERILSSTLEAQGHSPLRKQAHGCRPDVYDLNFLHADADLGRIARGLIHEKAARLCLYGPSGTGKTAFVHWLSRQVGMPLIVKRGSDLMSPYVGLSEQYIAEAFCEAEQSRALLLIDEVDSFLQDRRGARQTWEVTQVNEMLVQMEAFSGVFIASTNMMQGLDQAVLRRFDCKVKFDFLRPDQSWGLLVRYCALLGTAPPSEHLKGELARLTTLTPGDFAVIDRQHRLKQFDCADAILTALKSECSFKDGGRERIGFVR